MLAGWPFGGDTVVTASTTRAAPKPGTQAGIALVDDTGTLNATTLSEVLRRATGAMQAAAPQPGQRWAVLGENAAATVIAHAAGLLGGTGTAAVARQLTAGELAYQFREAGAVAAVAPVELAS